MKKLIGRKSLTFRLTLLFATVSSTVLLLLGLTIGALAERHFEELDKELLDGKLDLIGHTLKKAHTSSDLAGVPEQLEDALVGHPGLAVVVVAPDGSTLFSTPGAQIPASLLAQPRPIVQQSRTAVWQDAQGHPARGLAAEVTTGIPNAPSATIAVSTDLSRHDHFMHPFKMALWSIVVVAALITGVLGWVAARRGLAPLEKMRQSADSITANRLNQRLAVAAIPVELAEVAETLNEMLARLEASFQRLSDFSSDLAHELRTPVSNLLTQTQVTLSKARTEEEYRDVLASNAEEYERLSRTIADMLFLAKADNDLVIPAQEQVNLRTEADSILEFYEALAEENGIQLSIEGQATVSGDRLMLRRAIGNLLSNAFRHTPKGGQLKVRIAKEADGNKIFAVENTGETIPPEHLPRLFDRFYRADPSRRRDAEGAGLGLAITRSILRAHGGDATARSSQGVTVFVLKLPGPKTQRGTLNEKTDTPDSMQLP